MMQVHERRRVAFAAVITLAALPAWLLLSSGGGGTSHSTRAASRSTASSTPVDGTVDDGESANEKPVFLNNGVVVPAPAVIDIAVPGTTSPRTATATLTFRDYGGVPTLDPCSIAIVPSGKQITVTNIDNGKSTTCHNTLGAQIPLGADMAIDINLFIQIADLADAPVPVRITW